jgi:beta-N-acetylhexosaminidase
MTAHILYPAIDPTTPATMSELFISQILRQELGYQRIIVTDDLDMKAIKDQFEDGNMIGHALNVGCDMFIHARYPVAEDKRTITLAQNIARAVQEQKVSEETLFKSFCRINSVFEDLLSENKPHALTADVFEAHAALAREIKASA